MQLCCCLISKFIDILKSMLVVTCINSARRPVSLRTRHTRRLDPVNSGGVRSKRPPSALIPLSSRDLVRDQRRRRDSRGDC